MRLIDVSKSYEGKNIFENINYVFESGKIYWLKGKNGSGKSTLLRCLAKIEKFDSGTIETTRKKVLYLPEIELTEQWLTPRENINLLYRFAKLEIEDANYIYENLMFEEKDLDTISENCSKGTNMKVGLALMLKKNHWDLIIIDEALAHIDVMTQKSIFKEAKRRADEGSLVIITKHDDIDHVDNSIIDLNLQGDGLHEY